MAFNYGSQVNPALGRSDFSGILQGGMAQAQGVANAGKAWGEAYQNIGQSLSKGIDTYQKNQTIINDSIGKWLGAAKQIPDLESAAPEPVAKTIAKLKEGKSLSLSEASLLSSYSDSRGQDIVRQTQAANLDMMRTNAIRQNASDDANISTVKTLSPTMINSLEQLGSSPEALDSIKKGIESLNDSAIPLAQRAANANGILDFFSKATAAQNAAAEVGNKKEGNQLKAKEEARKIYISKAASDLAVSGTIPAYVKPEDFNEVKVLAAGLAKKGKDVSYGTDPQSGAATRVTTTVDGKQIVSPIQSIRPTPQETQQTSFATKIGTDLAAEVMNSVANVRNHVNTVDNINVVRKAYTKGVTTGVGAGLLNDAKSIVNTISGAPLFDLTAPDIMNKSFADFAIDAASRIAKQGQITEGERKLLADTVARLGNSEAGNLAIMEFMEAVSLREIEKAKHLAEAAKNGTIDLSTSTNFYIKNPLKLPSLIPPDAADVGRGMKHLK